MIVLFVITQWITKATSLGAVHKGRPQSKGRRFFRCGPGRLHFFAQKTSNFF